MVKINLLKKQENELNKPKRTGVDIAGDVIRSLNQGAYLGYGDEVTALVNYLGNKIEKTITGNSESKYFPNSSSYQESLDLERKRLKDFNKKSPFVAKGLEVAGAIPGGSLGVGKTIYNTMLKSMPVGFTYGSGASDGNLIDRASTGTKTALINSMVSPVFQKIFPSTTNQAQELLDKGIELTPGQATAGNVLSTKNEGSIFGNLLKSIEQGVEKIPYLGKGVKERLDDSITSFNDNIFDNFANNLGVEMPKNLTQREKYILIQDAVGELFNKSILNTTFKDYKSFKNTLISKLDDSQFLGVTLNNNQKKEIIRRFDDAFANKGDEISGSDIQAIDQTLNLYAKNLNNSGEEMVIGKAFNKAIDLFEENLSKNSKGNAFQDYKKAKDIYSKFKIVENAMNKNKIDANFNTNQYLQSASKTPYNKLFSRGKAPFQKLATDVQQVAGDRIPSSGTAERNLLYDTLGAVAGVATGVGMKYDPVNTSLALGALSSYATPVLNKYIARGGWNAFGKYGQGSAPVVSNEVNNRASIMMKNNGLLGE